MDRLLEDLRSQLLTLDAVLEASTDYGDLFRITGTLKGPNGRKLAVTSIWMIEAASGLCKFITLFPTKEASHGA